MAQPRNPGDVLEQLAKDLALPPGGVLHNPYNGRPMSVNSSGIPVYCSETESARLSRESRAKTDASPTPAQERAAAEQGLDYGFVRIPEDDPKYRDANRSPSIPKAVESVDGMGRKIITIPCFTCGRPTRSDAAMSSFMYIRGLIYCGWCSPRCECSYHRAWRSNLQGGAFVDGQQPA